MDHHILQIAVVADGDPESSLTNSGVASGLLNSLVKSGRVQVVGAVSSQPRGLLRVIALMVSFKFNRSAWQRAFRHSSFTIWLRTRIRDYRLRQLSDDILVVNVRNVYMASKRPFVSFIDTTQDLSDAGWDEWMSNNSKKIVALERAGFQAAQHVFTAGAHVRENVISKYGLDGNDVTAIGGGVNFDPLPLALDRSNQSESSIRILFVGREFERKGGRVLLSAFMELRQEIPDIELIVVGCNPDIDQQGVSVIGRVDDRSEMSKLYEKSDIFVLPAIFEPYGLVLQEAMIYSLPCVASNVGAIPEILEDGLSGILVPAQEPKALAIALRSLALDRTLRLSMGANARRRAEEQLTWDAVAQRMISVLCSL